MTEWRVTGVVLETPSEWVNSPHDLVGRGSLHVDGGSLHLAVRPKGLARLIPATERRIIPISGVTGWDVQAEMVQFTAGTVFVNDAATPLGGLIATNAARVPVHICTFHCSDNSAAKNLTDEVITAGLPKSKVQLR
jgi:hypothetical protein